MPPSFRPGDRVRLRCSGSDAMVMTVLEGDPDYPDFVELEYKRAGFKRRVGIVGSALVLVPSTA